MEWYYIFILTIIGGTVLLYLLKTKYCIPIDLKLVSSRDKARRYWYSKTSNLDRYNDSYHNDTIIDNLDRYSKVSGIKQYDFREVDDYPPAIGTIDMKVDDNKRKIYVNGNAITYRIDTTRETIYTNVADNIGSKWWYPYAYRRLTQLADSKGYKLVSEVDYNNNREYSATEVARFLSSFADKRNISVDKYGTKYTIIRKPHKKAKHILDEDDLRRMSRQ